MEIIIIGIVLTIALTFIRALQNQVASLRNAIQDLQIKQSSFEDDYNELSQALMDLRIDFERSHTQMMLDEESIQEIIDSKEFIEMFREEHYMNLLSLLESSYEFDHSFDEFYRNLIREIKG